VRYAKKKDHTTAMATLDKAARERASRARFRTAMDEMRRHLSALGITNVVDMTDVEVIQTAVRTVKAVNSVESQQLPVISDARYPPISYSD
jgi:hypothetical protein